MMPSEFMRKVLAQLPTREEVEAERAGKWLAKPLPTPLRNAARKQAKLASAAEFRKGVWDRDKARSRASKKPLAHSGSDFDRVGEVHHVVPRSLAPERIYDVSNGILLSRHEHALAEAICPNDPTHRLLDIDGPDDRGELQTFIWRDFQGAELKRRVG